ncbi:50S ribosomal protein L28 [Amycolatopsis pithecellobii]|uniref:Large ribosomal subunit protein bL28 n=1 Tax=Amycolatopsis pithecellobii TaxID=664692 RepID=A0A6N7Z9Z2_9PSEU|nr:50S ribosomal protein L28 [Amycolatopsis pithecellobii]MTD58554.1 50S ribosomal protein L28 [Amycolatopsis pithecellobii]
MSKVCQVTGTRPGYGKQVSHSHRRTSRRWEPNLQSRRFWLPSENRWIRLRVSARGIKTIDKRGIEAVAAELKARGVKL